MPALDPLTPLTILTFLDRDYPARLRGLPNPPASITCRGGPLGAVHTVAIVGSREPAPESIVFARELSGAVAMAGAVVVSGGALGVDAAAHEGAIVTGGRTWAVAGTGHEGCFPPAHAQLFETIARGPGTMVWPFASTNTNRGAFLARNRVLVALADAVVVVQAGIPSGALNAAAWARRLQKPLWVVPAAPWMTGFEGSRQLLDQGARPLTSPAILLASLGMGLATRAAASPAEVLGRAFSPHESAILAAISAKPLHTDEITARTGQSCQATSAVLLTLALENVLVEGPPGFFCRRDSHKR